jgi:hypothetical protein
MHLIYILNASNIYIYIYIYICIYIERDPSRSTNGRHEKRRGGRKKEKNEKKKAKYASLIH